VLGYAERVGIAWWVALPSGGASVPIWKLIITSSRAMGSVRICLMTVANHAKRKQLDLCWLVDLQKASPPLSIEHPIWIRSRVIEEGPTLPPERHPNCEFCFIERGAGTALVGREQMSRKEGDLLLYGPGVPHWFHITQYPFQFIAIHFLPSLLFDLAPATDAARILHRFTSRQSLAQRLIRPAAASRDYFRSRFNKLHDEFLSRDFGWEVKVRAGLVEMLVELMRWEQKKSRRNQEILLDSDWAPLERALHFLRNHVTEPIYARDLALAARVSESRLKVLFHDVLGTSWSHYLQGYRVHLAAARLCEPGRRITEIALDVGFENLSHFNVTFRSFMGVPPGEYAKRLTAQSAHWNLHPLPEPPRSPGPRNGT
jgi:AraC-like DNA-binding protein/mannose-6-phosphate isomerase-like protein (cupin superfamily)